MPVSVHVAGAAGSPECRPLRRGSPLPGEGGVTGWGGVGEGEGEAVGAAGGMPARWAPLAGLHLQAWT